jgi:hypothetical protein
VVAKVRERLALNKQTTHRIHMERFNLKKLNEIEGKKQYRVEISNRFAALENLPTTQLCMRKKLASVQKFCMLQFLHLHSFYNMDEFFNYRDKITQ